MAHYQLKHLDLSTRICLAGQMLDPQRAWGTVSKLAKTYGTSRKFLYGLRDRVYPLLEEVFQPRAPGPKASCRQIAVNQAYLDRTAVILSLLPPSLRNIQLAQTLMFGQHCSIGHLKAVLQQAGERAEAQNQQLHPPQPLLGEADEIYQTHRPCLAALDGYSLLLVHLSAQAECDTTTWGMILLELIEQGVRFADLALDGAWPLRAAINEAGLGCGVRPDLFHLYRTGRLFRGKLHYKAEQADKRLLQALQAAEEAQSGKHRPGRRPATPPQLLPLEEAQAQAEKAHQQTSLFAWLLDELCLTLRCTQPNGTLRDPAITAQEFDLLVEWMDSLSDPDVRGYAHNLQRLRDQLLAPLQELTQRLAPWRANLDPEWEALIIWAFQHRQTLSIRLEHDFPPALWDTVRAFWDALAHVHRASSHVEALNSWLRPFLTLHRSRPDWLLSLLQGFWNQHTFQRGKRRGHSPLDLAGLEAAPSILDWIYQLLAPLPTASLPAVLAG
jgi:hypothetical protein